MTFKRYQPRMRLYFCYCIFSTTYFLYVQVSHQLLAITKLKEGTTICFLNLIPSVKQLIDIKLYFWENELMCLQQFKTFTLLFKLRTPYWIFFVCLKTWREPKLVKTRVNYIKRLNHSLTCSHCFDYKKMKHTNHGCPFKEI